MAKKNFIKTTSMLSLLKQVHLGGIINECVMELQKGKATIKAVDITASIVFISTVSTGPKRVSGELGLGNIDLFVKFLGTIKEPKLLIDLTENRMIVSRKDKRRKLEYLLSQPGLIPTRLNLSDNEDTDALETFVNMIEVRAEITESFIKDFVSYTSTLKTKIVSVEVEDETVTFTLGPKSEHQFKLVQPLTEAADDDFSMKINGEYLSKILSVLEFDEDDDPITMGFGDDSPIVIETEDAMWAVSPSEELDEE